MESNSDSGEEFDIEHSETDSTCSALSSSSDNETDSNQSQNDISDEWTEINIETDIPAASPSFDFTANSQINEEISPSQFFNYFFDDELVQNIVDQTNLYYVQTIRKRPSTSSANVENTWSTTISEMRIFFAVTMTMSIVQKPEEKLYWTRRPSIFTPFYAKLMSHRKFSFIKKYLHFANNATYDPAIHPQPKLNKIWPVYFHLNRKFQEAYTPQQHITIDESLMLYKGRLGWVQYIPMKRARFGIKSYFLCESKSGYTYMVITYIYRERNNYRGTTICQFTDVNASCNGSHETITKQRLLPYN